MVAIPPSVTPEISTVTLAIVEPSATSSVCTTLATYLSASSERALVASEERASINPGTLCALSTSSQFVIP